MNRISAPIVLALLFSTLFLPAEDWPTYRRDRLRRAITPEQLQLPLKQLWAFKSRQSKHAPVPTRDPTRAGFPECSKYNLPIISAGDSVYFTSSVEGRVVSLEVCDYHGQAVAASLYIVAVTVGSETQTKVTNV